MPPTREEELRIECWTRALLALGTSYIFSKRAPRYKKLIRLITVLGIVGPLLLGGVVASYGTQSDALTLAIIISTPVALIQLTLSGVSLVYKWDDSMAYSLESQTDNRSLSDSYVSLAKFTPSNQLEFESKFGVLEAKEQARTSQDDKVSFSDKENRKGMRYGLFIFKRQCAGCNIQPISMKPSKCDVCGNF